VLLTTHSMKEADSLCSRIAILIRGRLYCIGTPLELKERFAKGYRLKLLLDGRANPSEVAAKLKDKFGSEV
jgi:ABC-type multidrug transport system ATPase subunit